MKPLRIASIFLILIMIVSSFNSCKKEKDSFDDNIQPATDQSLADNELNKIGDMMDNVAQNQSLKTQSSFLPTCAVVTIDTSSATRLITVDFGTTGCLCTNWDSKVRKGKVYLSYTGRYRQTGYSHSIWTENYFVNNNQHIIHKTVENRGLNASNQSTFNITVDDTIIFTANGGVFTWKSNRLRTWIAGESTIGLYSDDIYLIEGQGSGITRNGKNYTVTITEPIRVDLSCTGSHRTAGKITIDVSGKSPIYIDYGNGNCDNVATCTINGRTYTFDPR
ncbi:MAG: hypothetical protein LC115_13340 [Bacteroidia bacterium]|nr:hypothetical protein [Bacteroidia bacterium]